MSTCREKSIWRFGSERWNTNNNVVNALIADSCLVFSGGCFGNKLLEQKAIVFYHNIGKQAGG